MKVEIVLFDSMTHSSVFMDFDSFSYGDASYTLVHPQQLIRELKSWDDPAFSALINELDDIRINRPGVYIAFFG